MKEKIDLSIPAQEVTFPPFPGPPLLASSTVSSSILVLGTAFKLGISQSGFTFRSQATYPWRLYYSSFTPLVPFSLFPPPFFHLSPSLQPCFPQILSLPTLPFMAGCQWSKAKQLKMADLTFCPPLTGALVLQKKKRRQNIKRIISLVSMGLVWIFAVEPVNEFGAWDMLCVHPLCLWWEKVFPCNQILVFFSCLQEPKISLISKCCSPLIKMERRWWFCHKA